MASKRERDIDKATNWQQVQNEVAKALSGVQNVVNPNVTVPTLTQLSGGAVQGTGTYGGQTGVPPVSQTPQWYLDYQAQVAAEKAQKRQSAFDMLRSFAEAYDLPTTMADRLIDLVAVQGYTETAVNLELQKTPEFKERFAGIEKYKQNFASDIVAGRKAAAPTPSEYIRFEKSYQEVLNRFGLADLATRQTFSDLIGGDVSVAEVTDRIANVWDRMRSADDVLKTTLSTFFPMFGTVDFVKTLLTGKGPQDMAAQLQRKLAAAEISSEASRAGLTTEATRAEQLQAMGVSRNLARTGYSKIAEQQPVLQKLSEIYQQDITNLQQELEAEQFQGLASQRRKKLTETEQATFSGRAGTSTVSLAQQGKGTF